METTDILDLKERNEIKNSRNMFFLKGKIFSGYGNMK